MVTLSRSSPAPTPEPTSSDPFGCRPFVDPPLTLHQSLIDQVPPQGRKIRIATPENGVDLRLCVRSANFKILNKPVQKLDLSFPCGWHLHDPLTPKILGQSGRWYASLFIRSCLQLISQLDQRIELQRILPRISLPNRDQQSGRSQRLQLTTNHIRRQCRLRTEFLDRHHIRSGERGQYLDQISIGQRCRESQYLGMWFINIGHRVTWFSRIGRYRVQYYRLNILASPAKAKS